MNKLQHFARVWVFDFEYTSDPGEMPDPVCLVAVDLVTGERHRLWRGEMEPGKCPFDTGPASLFVCFSGAGDLGCFLQLGWPVPERLVDLFPEFRQEVYDLQEYVQPSLLNACRHYRIAFMDSAMKDQARDMIIERRYTDADAGYLLDYCEEDVVATGHLFAAMEPSLTASLSTWNGVLLRGRYSAALARMVQTGIPLDTERFNLAAKHWHRIKLELIKEVDAEYGCFLGTSFNESLFEAYVRRHCIPWPALPSGRLSLEDDTFRQMAAAWPQVGKLRELRNSLGEMRLSNYEVGHDGRNRVWLGAYGSVTGRNQPSNSRFVFGSSRWMRSFIKPNPGMALAYLDFANQEIQVNAALSGDRNMLADYASGDPYLSFAIRAGLAPEGATKATHPEARATAKQVMLGISYGMGPHGLAARLRCHIVDARELCQRYWDRYPQFGKFVRRVQDAGCMGETLRTRFDWKRRMKPGKLDVNRRSLQNWPAQAHGSEMLRIACCMLTEAGIRVAAPVHDAVLIEAPASEMEDTLKRAAAIMTQASQIVLGSQYPVRTDCEKVISAAPMSDPELEKKRVPDRYSDPAGEDFYATVMRLAEEAEAHLAWADAVQAAGTPAVSAPLPAEAISVRPTRQKQQKKP